jgi:hypothetical protein
MNTEAGKRLFIDRGDLHRLRFGPDPDASKPLADGQARLAIYRFALTANNITYAAFGETMKYWQFFPAPEPGWGCLPVWGFAVVAESRAEGVVPGKRVYGFFPAGSHLVVSPGRVSDGGFVDTAAHRRELPAVYQYYAFCDHDPAWQPQREGSQAVLKPLFYTAYLLDDFFADNGFFGAKQVLLSSASSKTAYGTAFCLAQRRGGPGAPMVVGLTSTGNVDFTRSLGCYDDVRTYAETTVLDPGVPSLYADFAGDAALRRRVHEHWGDALTYSCSIGATHWDALGPGDGLPGPRPTLFFAPAQARKRSAPPPEGWGRAGLEQRSAVAWDAFVARAERSDDPWLRIVYGSGSAATEAAYRTLLEGRGNAREGLMLNLGD